MSEDDRAAKAARAKAMLKKRQQKKVAESGGTTSDIALPSRTVTPAPPDSVEERKHQDIDDVFGAKNDSDTSWLSSLPRAPSPLGQAATLATALSSTNSPPPIVTSSVPEVTTGLSLGEPQLRRDLDSARSEITSLQKKAQRMIAMEQEVKAAQEKNQDLEFLLEQERVQYSASMSRLTELQKDTSIQLKNHEETISLLVSEKASLTSALDKLDEAEAKAQSTEEAFNQEKEKCVNLSVQLEKSREYIDSMTQSLFESQRKEKEMNEKYREQERQLQLVTALAAEARKDAERYQRSLKDLEEQIQNDDRLERVETSLKNTQERADELEFQLSKLKHAYSLLKAEKDTLGSQLSQSVTAKNILESRCLGLEERFESINNEISAVTEERDALMTEKLSFHQSSQGKDEAIISLTAQLAQAAMEVDSQKRQLRTLQTDLKTAQKRAEDTERTQQRLQVEGINLMRSLDELRPKIVELTEDKVQLSEKVAHLEHALRDRENATLNLEKTLDNMQHEMKKSQEEWKDRLSKSEQERSAEAASSPEMEEGFLELQKELENALNNIRALETERQSLRQEVRARLQETEQLSNTSRSQIAEIAQLQYELNERRMTEEEENFLQQAQNEVEALRSKLAAKATELEQLRQNQSPPSQNSPPQSLNKEMLNSLRQQHALDLSAAQSQIRALENSVFDAEARAHGLQKQVHALEVQLSQGRPSSRLGQRIFSPNHPSRPASQTRSELGRSSFSSSQRPSALSRSIFDQGLTPETLHKRKVSLSMLKARIESEVAASLDAPARPLSPIRPQSRSGPTSQFPLQHQNGHRNPQFLDESHVFWCSSCTGELVVL